MNFCLDTSFVVNYLRLREGYAKKVAHLRKRGAFKISIITYAELFYGMLRAAKTEAERVKLSGFIEEFEVEILPLTGTDVEIYAPARLFLEQKGAKIDDFDLLIAATAKANKATLVTDNPKHFRDFPQLKILN